MWWHVFSYLGFIVYKLFVLLWLNRVGEIVTPKAFKRLEYGWVEHHFSVVLSENWITNQGWTHNSHETVASSFNKVWDVAALEGLIEKTPNNTISLSLPLFTYYLYVYSFSVYSLFNYIRRDYCAGDGIPTI